MSLIAVLLLKQDKTMELEVENISSMGDYMLAYVMILMGGYSWRRGKDGRK